MKQKHPDSATHDQRHSHSKPAHQEQQEFELPDPIEKQSHKFILDSLRDRMLSENEPPHTSEAQAAGTKPLVAQAREIQLPSGKNYFRVREVAAILKVGAHVLRFWESEFSMVRPTKSRSGQRVYRRKDVEILARIRHLLHDQKLSIKTARETLLKERRERPQAQPADGAPTTNRKLASAVESTSRVAITTASKSPEERHLDLKELLVDLRQLIKMCRQDPFSFRTLS